MNTPEASAEFPKGINTPVASAEFPRGINTVLFNKEEIRLLKNLAARNSPIPANLLPRLAKRLVLRILTIPQYETTGVNFLGEQPRVSFEGDVARFANPNDPIQIELHKDEKGEVILIPRDVVEAFKNRPKPTNAKLQ